MSASNQQAFEQWLPTCKYGDLGDAFRAGWDASGDASRAEIERLRGERQDDSMAVRIVCEERDRLRAALEHCLKVFQSLADRGRYPQELLPSSEHYLGKQGWEFLTDALRGVVETKPHIMNQAERDAVNRALDASVTVIPEETSE